MGNNSVNPFSGIFYCQENRALDSYALVVRFPVGFLAFLRDYCDIGLFIDFLDVFRERVCGFFGFYGIFVVGLCHGNFGYLFRSGVECLRSFSDCSGIFLRFGIFHGNVIGFCGLHLFRFDDSLSCEKISKFNDSLGGCRSDLFCLGWGLVGLVGPWNLSRVSFGRHSLLSNFSGKT